MNAATEELHEVCVLGFPLALAASSTEHYEELMREFQLLAIRPPESTPGHAVPRRLIALISDVQQSYAGIGDEQDAQRLAAQERGEESVDLVYHVPEGVGAACDALVAMLEEADHFCRAGERLLTLATPALEAAFRRWYLGEFSRQLAGEPPIPWPDYLTAHPVEG